MKVACAQIAPVYLNVDATLEKMNGFTKEASDQGAQLIVFPELCLTMFPNMPLDLYDPKVTPDQAKSFVAYYKKFQESASTIPGPTTEKLGEIARKYNINIVTGINEKDPKYRGVMWNSSCVMDRKGQLIGRHRKLTPVLQELFYEKKGDIDDVRVFDLDVGTIGIGICAENWNPIYPSILGRLGEEIHCSLWMSPGANPNIASKPALSDLKEMVHHTAAAQAIQGTCFVICSVQVSSKKPDPAAASLTHYETGGSCIISPRGTMLVEAEDHKEQVITADIDLAEIGIQKIEFDQFGKDARDDLFRIVLKSGPTPPTPIVDRSERYVHVSIPELQESTEIRNLREELERAKEEIAKLGEELARRKRMS